MNLKRLRDSLDYTPDGWRYRSAFAQNAERGFKNKDFWDGVYPFSKGSSEKVSKHGRNEYALMKVKGGDWEFTKYGKKATLRRNTQIVREASTVIAFPSPDSKGTFHSIEKRNVSSNVSSSSIFRKTNKVQSTISP